MYVCMYVSMDGWMDVCMYGWMDGCIWFMCVCNITYYDIT